MQSSNMSAGGESSSEQVLSPQIIAHEDDLAWRDYDALDMARHNGKNYTDASAIAAQQAPTALSIMRRRRSGSEDVALARRQMLERNKGEERGEGVLNMNARFPRVTPTVPYPPNIADGGRYPVQSTPHRQEYMDASRYEQDFHRYYYEHDDPYYYGNYGFRDYQASQGHHAPMPSFLEDAYRRHQEMGYGAEMGTMRDRYYTKDGMYRDPISLSDHGPMRKGSSNPNLNPPRQMVQGPAPQRVIQQQHQPNLSPQRVANNNGRAYQEMDWKQDRLWREDNHTQTPSVVNDSAHQAPGQNAVQMGGQGRGYPPPFPPRFTSPQVQDCPPNIPVYNPKSKQPFPGPVPHTAARVPKKSVSFNSLQIRTYETILGDNPSCSTGPSLGLGWRYDPSHYTSTIDEYERHQCQHGCADPEDLVLHRFEREAILLNTGYTRQDLAESVRGITKVKNRRRQTVHNLPVAWVEERIEGCRRTLRRWVLNKDRTRSMYDEWKRNEMSNMTSRPVGVRGILIKRRSE